MIRLVAKFAKTESVLNNCSKSSLQSAELADNKIQPTTVSSYLKMLVYPLLFRVISPRTA